MINNPALTNLERELRDEEAKLNQIKNADKEILAKNVALNVEIKAQEEAIRAKKAEIVALELKIRNENNEIKKDIAEDAKLKGQIHSLDQKREQDHLKLVKMTRDQADAIRKAEQEKRIHPDIHAK